MRTKFIGFRREVLLRDICITVGAFLAILWGNQAARSQNTASADPPASDITGKWVGSVQAPFGELEYFYEFKMDRDGTLHGVHHSNAGDIPITEGLVRGTSIRFVEENEMFGTVRKSETTGEIAGDTIKLTQAMPRMGRPPAPGSSAGMSPAPLGGGPGPEMVGAPGSGPMPPGGVVGGTFALPPVSLHRGEPPPSYRAGALDLKTLPKVQLQALRALPANGLAMKPPMGWNSWNKFATHISDKTVREIADAIASNGMKTAGYEYIVIDDGWEWKRDENGKIVPNPNFPNMKALADYVHSKGLKLGIYSSPGPRTCGGYEGSYGHEEKDAESYAEWGIDYLKYDWCSASRVYQQTEMQAVYQKMGEALQKTGRPIVYALCQYGMNHVEHWGPSVGANLWRTTADISNQYDSMTRNGFAEAALSPYAGPGHWNDPDMLEIGNGGMSEAEYQTHLSLWAILAAPLLAGNDVRNLDDSTRKNLLNTEVIAVDQDSLGKQGFRVSKTGDSEVWAKPLANGAYAIALFNRSTNPQQIAVHWSELKIEPRTLRDLWAHQSIRNSGDVFSANVPAHGVVMIRASN